MGDLEVGFTVAFIIIMLAALAGNSLLIYIVWKKPETRTLITFMFVNMAVADLVTTLLQMPISISQLTRRPWFARGQAGKITCKCFYYAAFTSITASILCLTVIAVDRFYAVVYPFRNIGWIRNVKIITPVIWVVSLALMAISVTGVTLDEGDEPALCAYEFDEAAITERTFWIFIFIVNYLTPLIIISVLYAAVAYKLWYHTRPCDDKERNGHEERQKKKEVVRMLVIIVAVFAVCWLPVHVHQLDVAVKKDQTLPRFVIIFSYFLSQGNSAINPWLYMGLNRKFRTFGFSCADRNKRREEQRELVQLQRKAIEKAAEGEDSDHFGNKL